MRLRSLAGVFAVAVFAILATAPHVKAIYQTGISYNVVFKNANSSKCLEVYGQSLYVGAVIDQWDCWYGNNQKWNVIHYDDLSEAFQNVNSGGCIDDGGGSQGVSLTQQPCQAIPSQRFYQRSMGDGLCCWGFYNIVNSMYIEVYNWSTSNGAMVDEWPWNGGGRNQEWIAGPG